MFDAFSRPVGMVIATLIGFGFGFVLERSGFGRAPVLAAQFYGTNMRVFKVMFSAIVTAMLGIAILSGLGLLAVGEMRISATWIWPQLIGGLLLGVGFIVAGYCPGTAVVATGSGNMDGLAALAGTLTGSVVFGFAYPTLADFYQSGSLGVSRLPEVLPVPEPLIVVAVVLMAIGGFFGAEWLERRLAHLAVVPELSHSPRQRNGAFLGFGVATATGLVVAFPALSMLDTSTVRSELRGIDALELARGLVHDPSDYYLVDLRTPAAPIEERIPGAMTLPDDDPEGHFLADLPPTRTLVFYGAADLERLPAGAQSYDGKAATLLGGFSEFQAQVLTEPAAPTSAAGVALAHHALRSALHAHFTGAAPAAPVEIKPVKVKRARKKEGGC